MQPDISVVIATYNAEHCVLRAVESALSQDHVSVEVIVVDDASTDNTLGSLKQIHDDRVRIIALTENKGPGGARQAGFAAAKAPWIAVLDSDDIFLPHRLERMLLKATSTSADIVVDNLRVYRAVDGQEFPMFDPTVFAAQSTLDLPFFIRGIMKNAGSYSLGYLKPLFRKSFLNKHNLAYLSDLRIGEDYVLFAEALACGATCVLLPEEGYHYTAQAGSISHRLTPQTVKAMIDADALWTARRDLTDDAQIAQVARTKDLKNLYAYNLLVAALKTKKLLAVVRLTLASPRAVLGLWEPIWVRLKRIMGRDA